MDHASAVEQGAGPGGGGGLLSGALGRRVALVLMAVALMGPAAVTLLRETAMDPTHLADFRGQSGPYEALPAPGGGFEPGAARAEFAPGERFAWISDICVRAGVSTYGIVRFRRMVDEAIVAAKTVAHPGGSRGCGPAVGDFVVPEDAAPGGYALERETVLSSPSGGSSPRRYQFPPIGVEVVAKRSSPR
jgi:hypothetical protein